MELGSLSASYESNGDAGAISSGYMDYGGKSYGAYQLASNTGSVDEFIAWAQGSNNAVYRQYGNYLFRFEIASAGFDQDWADIATNDGDTFAQMQHDYIKHAYYDVAVELLRGVYFNIENHSEVMKDVIWSRAVQYDPYNVPDMFVEALAYFPTVYPNLSYVDDLRFDWDIINGVYEVCKTPAWNNSALRDSLNKRFDSEKQEALALFSEELK